LEITKREIIASISIMSIMFVIGIFMAGLFNQKQMDQLEIYNTSVKIESSDLFRYSLDTNIGHAFVYGNLEAVDTVTYPEIGNKYMYIKKVKERYTMHTRRVKRGKHYFTEHYWTWDNVGSESLNSSKIKFSNTTFDFKKIKIPSAKYLTTIHETTHVRYKYYVCETKYTGTIFTKIDKHTIENNTSFYNKLNIAEAIEHTSKMCKIGVFIFWTIWIIITFAMVFSFYYFENKWLE